MKFHLNITAGRFFRKQIREALQNSKRKLEFKYPECRVLVTEEKQFWESNFYIEGVNIPDEAAPNIKSWMNRLKNL